MAVVKFLEKERALQEVPHVGLTLVCIGGAGPRRKEDLLALTSELLNAVS